MMTRTSNSDGMKDRRKAKKMDEKALEDLLDSTLSEFTDESNVSTSSWSTEPSETLTAGEQESCIGTGR